VTRAAAVAAAERGWAVFPCRPGDKRPAVQDWERRACADPETIGRYWPSQKHNVGIACGPSGLVAVDLDTHGELSADWQLPGVHDGKDVFAQICEWAGMEWPTTHTVTTPSGGWHLYFRAPEGAEIRNSASLIGPMVDVRGRGGYVVGECSVIGGQAYEALDDDAPAPMPQWIVRLLVPSSRIVPARTASSGTTGKRLEGLLRTVEQAKPGTRNETLFWAASRAAEMTAEGSITPADATAHLAAAAAAAGLTEHEALRTIQSALKGTR
jgi:hypothetical protein